MEKKHSTEVLKNLLEYNHFVNQELGQHLEKIEPELNSNILNLVSHVSNAQSIWLARIEGAPCSLTPWSKSTLTNFRKVDSENYLKILEVISTNNLSRTIDYTNSKGKQYQNVLSDILVHLVNHGTYHRGQIAMELRNIGLEPIPTDYILFQR